MISKKPFNGRKLERDVDPYDVPALEKSVNDSAVRLSTLWVSYLVFGLYLVTATGNVTQRQLFLEAPIKLPVLNIDLPLLGFFLLAPVLFFVFHGYVLLQLVLFVRTAGVYNEAVDRSTSNKQNQTRIRQRLANTLFAQMFAGSPREREGLLGLFLKVMAWLALVVGPVCVLLVFDFKFLPYHNHTVTWTHRILIAADLLLVLLLWPTTLDPKQDLKWGALRDYWKASLAAASFVFLSSIALSFPGELIAGWSRYRNPVPADAARYSECSAKSIFTPILSPDFDRLSLPGEYFVDDDKLARMENTRKIRGDLPFEGEQLLLFNDRDFSCGNFEGDDLRRTSFRSTTLMGARFRRAQLRGASFEDARLQGAILNSAQLQDSNLRHAQFNEASLANADLRGATLESAILSGVSLKGANLQNADLNDAQLQGADLSSSRLQNADFTRAHMQGASFDGAQLQFARLYFTELQGASFAHTNLQAARFKETRLQGAFFFDSGLQGASFQVARLQGASFESVRLQGAFFEDSQPNLAHFSNAFLWHTRITNKECRGMQVSNPQFDAVIGLDQRTLGMLPASPESFQRFLDAVSMEFPEDSLEAFHQTLKFAFDPNEMDAVSAKIWQACAVEALSDRDYEDKLSNFLISLFCDDATGAIAERTARNLIRLDFNMKLPSAKSVARGLLRLEGNACPGANGLSKDIATALKKRLAEFPDK